MAVFVTDQEKPLVLIVCPLPMMPVTGGGAARIWGYVQYMREQGFRVGLVSIPHGVKDTRAIRALCDDYWDVRPPAKTAAPTNLKLRVKRRLKRVVPNSVAAPLRKLRDATSSETARASNIARQRKPELDALVQEVARAEEPAAVIASCVWTARALEGLPSTTLTLIDTIDIQHRRAESARDAGHNLDRTWCTAEEEIEELLRAEVLIAIETEELGDLRVLCPEREVLLAEHAMEVPPQPCHAPLGACDVLMVGNLYEPNVIGMNEFIARAWPGIREKHPEARLIICGRMGRRATQDVPGVVVEGIVPSLDPYYARAAVVINPVPYGTGLKIKTVEALCLGKAVVATPSGARGLLDVDDAFRVCEIDAMADEVCALLQDEDARHALETAAHAFARDRFAPEHAYRALVERIRQGASAAGAISTEHA